LIRIFFLIHADISPTIILRRSQLETFFLQESKQALALKSEISKTDQEIDRMVYELYGLTEEEIKILEGK
jgi:type II restriction/modification system DNA methylase subunit YeeA